MPLDRAHTTAGGWTAVQGYPIFLTVVGTSLVFADPDRLQQTPGFAYANRFLPFDVWGWVFLGVAVALAAALATKRRSLYQQALSVAMLWLTVWAALLAAAYFHGQASPSAWAWPAMIVWHMWAVEVSLASGQRG